MQLHYLSAAALSGFDLSGPGFYIAVALLACLLGAVIAGICILISKAIRSDREKESGGSRSSHTLHCGVGVVMLGAIPQSAYALLSGLAWAIAVAAVVFLIALIVLLAKGYFFLSAKEVKALNERKTARESETRYASDPIAVFAEEEQRQEAYTPAEVSAEQAPAALADEDAAVQEVADELVEADREPTPDSCTVLPAVVEQGGAVNTSDRAFADGTRPYKIVEKIVTETEKEIVREVPAQGGAKTDSAAAEQLMEKLTDFLDYELQKRKEADQGGEAVPNDIPVSLKADPDFDEEDDEEDELDEADDSLADEENDIDDEEPDGEDRFTGNERIIGFDEATGCYIVAHYRKSFEAKLIQARPRIKQYYSELKNELLSYKGNKSRISWAADSFTNGREQIAKINVKTNILELYLAIDPDTLEDSVYHGKNVGHKKKYSETPFLYKLRTPRKFKWAMELVQRTCEEHGLSPIDIEKIDYEPMYPFESTESLVARKLIKEYIREEKPATTFELAPDHVPAVPDEDESVIPANANFSWEFDNEMLEQKEEPAEEPAPEIPEPASDEPSPEPEQPAEEPAPVPSEPVVVRETVKVTEMRYTERYYGDADPIYEQTVTTTEPIEAEELLTEDVAPEDVAEELEESLADDFAEPAEFEEPFSDGEEPLEESSYETLEDEVIAEPISDAAMFDGMFGTENPNEQPEVSEEVFEVTDEDDGEYYFDDTPAAEPAEEEYAEEESAEEEYAEEEYTEEEYATEEYAEEEYAEEEYAEESAAVAASVDPDVAVIDICAIADSFENGETVNLEALKERGLVLSSATTLKIYATGDLEKALSVEANHFTLDAIYAISAADGDTSMIY